MEEDCNTSPFTRNNIPEICPLFHVRANQGFEEILVFFLDHKFRKCLFPKFDRLKIIDLDQICLKKSTRGC